MSIFLFSVPITTISRKHEGRKGSPLWYYNREGEMCSALVGAKALGGNTQTHTELHEPGLRIGPCQVVLTSGMLG